MRFIILLLIIPWAVQGQESLTLTELISSDHYKIKKTKSESLKGYTIEGLGEFTGKIYYLTDEIGINVYRLNDEVPEDGKNEVVDQVLKHHVSIWKSNIYEVKYKDADQGKTAMMHLYLENVIMSITVYIVHNHILELTTFCMPDDMECADDVLDKINLLD